MGLCVIDGGEIRATERRLLTEPSPPCFCKIYLNDLRLLTPASPFSAIAYA